MNIGTLDPNETAKPYLVNIGELEKVNHATICCFVDDTLRDYTLMVIRCNYLRLGQIEKYETSLDEDSDSVSVIDKHSSDSD